MALNNNKDSSPDSSRSDPSDPFGTASTSCRTVVSSADDPVAATYRFPVVDCPYTLLGSPTVIADLTVVGDFSEIASRLWDVAPDGSQSLVTHGLYRPRLDNLGPQPFQLHPTGWQFAAGHQAKLELLGQSAPYGRASNGTFTITATSVEVRLPVLETPGGCDAVQAPAAPVFPPSAPEVTTSTTSTSSPSTTTTTQPPGAPHLVLGSSFQLKNPGSEVERKLKARAQERSSDESIVGDPVATGASLEVFANGATSSTQTFSLPKEGWRASGAVGFRYSGKLPGGPVKKASIKRTPGGVFQIKVLIAGRGGLVTVVPPNPGTDGGFVLTLIGGDSYCAGFGGAAGGTEIHDDASQWYVKYPTAESCPTPP